jgi:heat-inducible transcriptional repressor
MSYLALPGRMSREDPDLSDRLRDVFVALVRLHDATARPVGSESLSRQAGVRLSPASIRSALAELEALGLLERAHASSARVPTAHGYEFFVRVLLQPASLPDAVLEQIRGSLHRSTRDVEALLQEASRLLSTLTQQVGLAVARSLEDVRLRRIDLESLGEQRALLVLGLEDGAAQTLVLELESPLDPDDLRDVESVLRERLIGHVLSEVRERMALDRELIRRTAVRLVVRAANARWTQGLATPLISSGTSRIAQQPEFATAEQLSPILRAVEFGTPLDRLMVTSIEGQAAVRVGVDATPGLAGCSLVSFALPGQVRGAVGVLGPLRMNYAFALAAVDMVGARVAELLQA